VTSLTITIPLPPRELWQNSRCHWARRSRVGAKSKESAYTKSLAKIGRKPKPMWRAGTLDTVWYWPDKRRRDPLNALAALKHAVDGMVLAGVLADDDKLMPGVTRFEIDADNPRVEITVKEQP
jgi:Holliday junction resolvase RusA-like endonuclease